MVRGLSNDRELHGEDTIRPKDYKIRRHMVRVL